MPSLNTDLHFVQAAASRHIRKSASSTSLKFSSQLFNMFSRPMPNLLASILFVQGSIAGYVLTDDYSGDKFFGGFTAFTGTDPTTGFVQYLDYNHATSSKLIGSVSGASFIGVDSTSQSAQGRASVRISSVKSYNKGLVIGDFAHVPDGTCGVWPAFWMVGPNWPQHGEVDIYEGVK